MTAALLLLAGCATAPPKQVKLFTGSDNDQADLSCVLFAKNIQIWAVGNKRVKYNFWGTRETLLCLPPGPDDFKISLYVTTPTKRYSLPSLTVGPYLLEKGKRYIFRSYRDATGAHYYNLFLDQSLDTKETLHER